MKAFFSHRQQYNCEQPGQAVPLSALTVPKQRTQFCLLLLVVVTIAPPEPPPSMLPKSPRGAEEAPGAAPVLALAALDFFPMVSGRLSADRSKWLGWYFRVTYQI
jgi:hypothetical protein